jgi:hypothetical protein
VLRTSFSTLDPAGTSGPQTKRPVIEDFAFFFILTWAFDYAPALLLAPTF